MALDNDSQQAELTKFPTYIPKATYPTETPTASIFFDGLLYLCFDGSTKCTVGVNNKNPLHTLRLQIREKASGQKIDIELPDRYGELEIKVNDPIEHGAYVYAPPRGSTPINNRCSFVDYYPDLESPKFHDTVLTKTPSALWPRFYIGSALFSGLHLSPYQYALKVGNGRKALGGLATGLVADIFLRSGGSIEFIVDGKRLTAPVLRPPNQYEIGLTNSGPGCGRASLPAGRVSDFYMHYETVSVPTTEQLDLIALGYTGPQTLIQLGTLLTAIDSDSEPYDLCQPYPCMGVCYGRTQKFE